MELNLPERWLMTRRDRTSSSITRSLLLLLSAAVIAGCMGPSIAGKYVNEEEVDEYVELKGMALSFCLKTASD